jgi:hypothetical protein
MIKNKGGWIKVVEAFTAVLLIGGVLILILNQNNEVNSGDISSKIYDDEKAILRAVELDDALRTSILGISDSSLPLIMNDTGFPQNVKAKIEQKNPGYLICDAKICKMGQECVITNTASIEVYSTYTIIFANYQTYNPRKLVLSCVLI